MCQCFESPPRRNILITSNGWRTNKFPFFSRKFFLYLCTCKTFPRILSCAICLLRDLFDQGLMLETSALETPYGGQWDELNYKFSQPRRLTFGRWLKFRTQNSEQQKRIFRSAGFQTKQFIIYSIRSIREKIGVCLTVDLQTFYPSKADGQGVLVDPNSVERTQLCRVFKYAFIMGIDRLDWMTVY